LDRLSTDFGKEWHKDPTYQLIWGTQYQDVVDDYCKEFMKLGEDWLSSPAGRRFQEVCVKSRKAAKALPTLDVACIRQYDGLKGIDFDGHQISFVFGVLAEVAETSSYPMSVCPLHITWLTNRMTPLKEVDLNGSTATTMLL
jgi:hypothetical protein